MDEKAKRISERRKQAARRALAEASARAARRIADAPERKETGGPSGLEPTRYGDWERKGIASDF